jgi:hypothetical protein
LVGCEHRVRHAVVRNDNAVSNAVVLVKPRRSSQPTLHPGRRPDAERLQAEVVSRRLTAARGLAVIIVSESSAKPAPRVHAGRSSSARNRMSAARSNTPRQVNVRRISVHTAVLAGLRPLGGPGIVLCHLVASGVASAVVQVPPLTSSSRRRGRPGARNGRRASRVKPPGMPNPCQMQRRSTKDNGEPR